MNISGIPRLHAAAGFSLREAVGPGATFSSLATSELTWLRADRKRKSALKQEFGILEGRDIV